jgi:hypothetical protein
MVAVPAEIRTPSFAVLLFDPPVMFPVMVPVVDAFVIVIPKQFPALADPPVAVPVTDMVPLDPNESPLPPEPPDAPVQFPAKTKDTLPVITTAEFPVVELPVQFPLIVNVPPLESEHVNAFDVPACMFAFIVIPAVLTLKPPPAVAVVVAPSLNVIDDDAAVESVSPVGVVTFI